MPPKTKKMTTGTKKTRGPRTKVRSTGSGPGVGHAISKTTYKSRARTLVKTTSRNIGVQAELHDINEIAKSMTGKDVSAQLDGNTVRDTKDALKTPEGRKSIMAYIEGLVYRTTNGIMSLADAHKRISVILSVIIFVYITGGGAYLYDFLQDVLIFLKSLGVFFKVATKWVKMVNAASPETVLPFVHKLETAYQHTKLTKIILLFKG
jgi:hypothetical protein